MRNLWFPWHAWHRSFPFWGLAFARLLLPSPAFHYLPTVFSHLVNCILLLYLWNGYFRWLRGCFLLSFFSRSTRWPKTRISLMSSSSQLSLRAFFQIGADFPISHSFRTGVTTGGVVEATQEVGQRRGSQFPKWKWPYVTHAKEITSFSCYSESAVNIQH